MLEIHDWIPKSSWTVVIENSLDDIPVRERYTRECESIQRKGKRLFELGLLPEFVGTVAPTAFQGGTGGNFAIRKPGSHQWIVTAKGSHKGHLRETDFVEVVSVDWKNKKIHICRDTETTLPSTDSLLVAMVFENNPEIHSWVHFHATVETTYVIRLPYPTFEPTDRKALSDLVHQGARVINMIDHDLRKIPNGTTDSTIIVGEDAEFAFRLAEKLITEKSEFKKFK